MISTYTHQKDLHQERLRLKTQEQQFANVITAGTNCSPFESEIVVQKAKEAFAIGEHEDLRHLQPGQLVWEAVDQKEPPGKLLKDCQLKRIILSYVNQHEDLEAHDKYGTSGQRRQQIVRMTDEARDQGALLTQEDLGFILGTDVRTIRSDVQRLRQDGIEVPTRGQQKDIGPGVTHRQKAVELYLAGKEPLEIARQIKHSLKAVERYVDTFCRVVYCQKELRNALKTALVVGISVSAVNRYLDIYHAYREKDEYQAVLAQIEDRGRSYWKNSDFFKKCSPTERRPK